MATLNFTKNGDKWVADATVNKDYILHVERASGGIHLGFESGSEVTMTEINEGA